MTHDSQTPPPLSFHHHDALGPRSENLAALLQILEGNSATAAPLRRDAFSSNLRLKRASERHITYARITHQTATRFQAHLDAPRHPACRFCLVRQESIEGGPHLPSVLRDGASFHLSPFPHVASTFCSEPRVAASFADFRPSSLATCLSLPVPLACNVAYASIPRCSPFRFKIPSHFSFTSFLYFAIRLPRHDGTPPPVHHVQSPLVSNGILTVLISLSFGACLIRVTPPILVLHVYQARMRLRLDRYPLNFHIFTADAAIFTHILSARPRRSRQPSCYHRALC
ncbi:hypothetical protein C8R47DRAFT_395396 [Mycena vitilis]|nr:hypothetical protein C8R47DRAFT_395396 [Mycena vitilis]